MTDDELRAEYTSRHQATLSPVAHRLAEHLRGSVSDLPRIDRVSARAKGIDRFMGKATKVIGGGGRKYADPLNQIQDQIGARIITFYLQDVEAAAAAIERYYNRIELRSVVPESFNEFGYESKHYVLALPEDVFEDGADRRRAPKFFELQIRTLFQHAWSEAEHDVGYKATQELTLLQRRQMAFAAAQAWGADHIFSTLNRELADPTAPKRV
jgi:putative GTP pyrophosphokinase